MESAFQTTEEERNALLVAIIVTAFAYQAFSGLVVLGNLLHFLGVAALVVLARELGQRLVAEYTDSKVRVELSREGVLATVFGGIVSALSGLPIILLLPLTSSFESVEYTEWGKTVRGVKMRRDFWIATGGIAALFLSGVTASILRLGNLPDYFLIFAAFQLIPLDHEDIPAGLLDGVYILRQNVIYWLLISASTLFALALV
ncbi:MAG: hypothetical protein ABEJ98_05630 [Candidatus Nanohaloarchaea archaeon]